MIAVLLREPYCRFAGPRELQHENQHPLLARSLPATHEGVAMLSKRRGGGGVYAGRGGSQWERTKGSHEVRDCVVFRDASSGTDKMRLQPMRHNDADDPITSDSSACADRISPQIPQRAIAPLSKISALRTRYRGRKGLTLINPSRALLSGATERCRGASANFPPASNSCGVEVYRLCAGIHCDGRFCRPRLSTRTSASRE